MTELPEWARGYAKDTLYQASQLTDVNKNPYKAYDQNRIAGFTPMQEQAQQGAANMQPNAALGTGMDMAKAAGMGALGTNYQAGQFGNQFQAPGAYQPGSFGYQGVGTQSFTQPGAADAYMNPYMQNVVDIQKREAGRQSGIQGTQQQAQATQAGAFGGGRDAIMRAERERNLGQQMGDIQAQGSNAAFQQAQQQFNAEQGRGLQAQMANQQAGLNTQQMGEQSRQFGAGQGLQAAGLGAQYGLAGQQLGEQSRQYGAGLGLQGLQTGLQAAGQLGQLGQAQYGQQMGINQLQNQYGTQQQQQNQRPLDQAYQDFLNQQNYPYKQLGFMSDMVRGLPLGQQGTAQMYQAPPSMMQNVAAAGLGAYGLKQLGMFAKGGQVKSYAGGGELNPMDDPNRMTAAVSKLSDEQLKQIVQHPSSEAEKQAAETELATRASEKQGLASAYNALPAAAGGGMVAFGRGGIMHFAAGTNPYNVEDTEAGAGQNDEDDQIPNTMGNAALQAQLSPLILAKAKQIVARQPFADSNETEEEGVTRSMDLVNKIAGPSPYGEIQSQLADLTAQGKDALEQGKGLAALSAMGAIVQGPNFMRALGGAGTAFADSYKGALAANQSAKMSIAQMNINLANGQRAEKLGLVKDAMGSYQAARKNKVDAYKAQQEADYKALRGLSYAERAAQPPRPAAAPKPSVQSEGVAIYAKSLRAKDPTLSEDDANALALTRYNQERAAGLPGVTAAVSGRTEVAAGAQSIDVDRLRADAAEKAAVNVEKGLLLNTEYRNAMRGKDPKGRTAAQVRDALVEAETRRILKDTQLAPAAPAAPATPAAPKAAGVATAPPINLLKEGTVTTFKNGQKWTIKAGKPVQVN